MRIGNAYSRNILQTIGSNEVKIPRILIILGVAAVLSGCSSMPSVIEPVTGMKDSFTDSLSEIKDSVAGSVAEVQEALALSPLPSSAAPEKLTEDEVRTLLVGNTVESQDRNTQLNSITYYHPKGQVVQKRMWSKSSGRWAIEENGQICLEFGDRSMQCRHIVKEGDRYYKVRSNSDGELQKIVRYRSFAEGNRLVEGS